MDVDSSLSLPDQAAEWLAGLESPECSPGDRAAFEAWLATSTDHVEAFLEVEAAHAMAARLAGDAQLSAAIPAPVPGARAVKQRRRWRWVSAAIAASVVAVVFGAVLMRGFAVAPVEYATARGELREVLLDDGTRMLLDSNTHVAVEFGPASRTVEVLDGRVQFDVGQDRVRPFEVLAGAATVRDIGTLFQVERSDDAVEVGLIEGIVDVSWPDEARPRRLLEGQRVTARGHASLPPTSRLDLEAATGWPQGQLVFKARPLDQVLAESNRYSRIQLQLAEPELAELRISGVFDSRDQMGLVASLERDWGLRAEHIGESRIALYYASTL